MCIDGSLFRVETHDSLGGCRQPVLERVQGDDRVDFRVFDHERESLFRPIGIKGYIHCASLQNAEQAHHHVQRPFDRNTHWGSRSDPLVNQVPGKAVRTLVELPVGALFPFIEESDGLGRSGCLFLEGGVNAKVLRKSGRGIVPVHQNVGALLFGQYR